MNKKEILHLQYVQLLPFPTFPLNYFQYNTTLSTMSQKAWKQIYSEWQPTTTYKQAGFISFERYTDDDPSSAECYSEIWIPIK